MDLAQGFDLASTEAAARVLIAGGLGALVGLDRELADQPAGLRTHVLVSLGACLFTLAGAYAVVGFSGEPSPQVDPTRVAAQVVTGIGFLGAGAIIRQGFSVRGLTTAAGLWVTAAIGTAVGLGYYEGAGVTTISAVVALYGLKRLERSMLRRLKPGRYRFEIDAGADLKVSAVTELLEDRRCRVDSVQMETSEQGSHHFVMQLRLPPRMQPPELVAELQSLEGVQEVDWTR